MSHPPISIIMCSFNDEKFISKSIKSILNQSLKHFEFIIVNDGSVDNTSKIIHNYSKIDKRIKIIENKKNLGLTQSLRIGIQSSRGEFLARQDSDDISHKDRLKFQLQFMRERPDYLLIGTGIKRIDPEGKPIELPTIIRRNNYIKAHLNYGNAFVHGSLMFKRDLYEKVGGYRPFFKYAQDFDLILRMSKFGKIDNLNQRLYSWRENVQNISSDKAELQVMLTALALYEINYKNKPFKIPEKFDEIFLYDLFATFDQKIVRSILGHLWFRRGDYNKSCKYLKNLPKKKDKIFYFISLRPSLALRLKKIHRKMTKLFSLNP